MSYIATFHSFRQGGAARLAEIAPRRCRDLRAGHTPWQAGAGRRRAPMVSSERAAEALPGCRFRRLWLGRYLLVWKKPDVV